MRFLLRLPEAQLMCSVLACVTQAIIIHLGLGVSTVAPGGK